MAIENGYPAYKDSGTGWLGLLPASWAVTRLKYCISDFYGGGTPPSGDDSYWSWDGGGVPWVTIGDMTREAIVTNTERYLSPEGLSSKGLRIVPAGTLLYSIFASLGKVAVLGIPAALNQAILGIAPDTRVLTRDFLRYWLIQMEQHVLMFSSTNTQDNLNKEKVRDMPIFLPSLPEQIKIAAYLDKCIRPIDELVVKKKQQVHFFQESRNAHISRVLTQGLNPKTPMKDAGIGWIEEIPEHWLVNRTKSVFYEVDDRSRTGEEELLTVSHITGVTPRSSKNVNMFMAETLKGYKKCRAGDLIINTMWAWMGALGIAFQDGIVSPSYNVYRFRSSEYEPRYYDRLFRTKRFRDEINRFSKGVWTSRLRLYPDEFYQIRIPCPPKNEQEAISNHLDLNANRIDKLVSNIKKSIDVLSGYRRSLIVAAVTGKIDIQGKPLCQ